MATEEKKRYWLKLDKNFLKSSQIKVIKNMPNGKDYVIFYLSLLLESVETIGHLRFSNSVPYNEEMLASVTDTNVDIVRSAIKIFESLGLMEMLEDGTIYMSQVPEMTGKESESVDRVRAYRERIAKRKNVELNLVKKVSKEQIQLPDGSFKFIDNKRYGGNAEYVYELANCKCEVCGENQSELLLIHHNNGYSNDLEDLYLLCRKCHSNVENGNITDLKHNRVTTNNTNIIKCNANVTECNGSVTICNNDVTTCNTNVTKCNDNKEKEKEKDKQRINNREERIIKTTITKNNNIYNYIEQNFGRSISPIEYETISNWLLSYEEEIITYAVKIAVMGNKKTFNYVNGILNNWKSCGYKTLQDIKDNELKKKTKDSNLTDEEKEILEYDWLNENDD